ncbi:MAG TPA: NAD(P)/FAD-dependent oxidoreductase [Steroidobacteraceae bacterium]|jgi:thioredoxin reductase|nr:NAD(P)/FAD-dependent oxidoreductase [Steroidobacteraceae bacterium]
MRKTTKPTTFDVVIAGAGPAGLSAALVLGRARRDVLLCDTGTPRSWASKEMHAYLSRDGMSPQEFLALGRREVRRYPGVHYLPQEVCTARRVREGFAVRLANGREVQCRKLLIATGVFDIVPRIPGIDEMFGRSVFQCPYCDGWEMRDRAVLAYGRGQRGFEMARAMSAWTSDLVLCTDGAAGFPAPHRKLLDRHGIRLVEKRIESLEGSRGRLRTVVFRGGERLARDAMFFDTPSRHQSKLAESLGCKFGRNGGVMCGEYEATSVPGVFVAGNIIRDVQLTIVAAAEGARAAFGINRTLTREDFA